MCRYAENGYSSNAPGYCVLLAFGVDNNPSNVPNQYAG